MNRQIVCFSAVVVLICLSLCAEAALTDCWSWAFKHEVFAGTDSLALDGYDPLDVAKGDYYRPAYAGIYREAGSAGWNGPSGFYDADMRAPLELVSGKSKTWSIYLWADLAYQDEWIGLSWNGPVPAPALANIEFRLTYVRAAIGIVDDRVGMSAVFNDCPDGGWWSFPAYRTENGLDGYVFDLTATVIPEPSALAALLCGLGGVLLRRRR